MIQLLYGLHFPPIAELLEWPGILFNGTAFELNKVGLIYLWAMLAPLAIFVLAIRKSALVPKGVQTVAESSIDFVRENVVMQTIGPDGMRFMPFLLSLFFFIFFGFFYWLHSLKIITLSENKHYYIGILFNSSTFSQI